MPRKPSQPEPTLPTLLPPDDNRPQLGHPTDLWLPDPQPRAVLPPLPGKREDGRIWFEDAK